MIFTCPCCKQIHTVPDRYDNSDFECPNTGKDQKTFNDVIPNDQLSRTAFNSNRSSTLTNEARPVTIRNIKPEFRPTGEKIGDLKTN